MGMWVALTAAAGLFAATAAPGASAKQCQAGFTEARAPQALEVTGDTCAKGRKVAFAVAAAVPSGCVKASNASRKLTFRMPCRRLGYSCTAAHLSGGTALRVTCTRGAKRVRFRY
jgi:hypothetical protein